MDELSLVHRKSLKIYIFFSQDVLFFLAFINIKTQLNKCFATICVSYVDQT